MFGLNSLKSLFWNVWYFYFYTALASPFYRGSLWEYGWFMWAVDFPWLSDLAEHWACGPVFNTTSSRPRISGQIPARITSRVLPGYFLRLPLTKSPPAMLKWNATVSLQASSRDLWLSFFNILTGKVQRTHWLPS